MRGSRAVAGALATAGAAWTCAVGLACAGPGQSGIYYASGQDAVTPDGLHRVQWEPFRLSFVKPGADLARYDQVLVDDVTISYKRPPDPAHPLDIDPNFALSSEGVALVKKKFREEFEKELANSSSFSIAKAPGPRVLAIQGHLVDLVMTTPSAEQQPVDQTIVTGSFGEVTLMLDARDSQSGEPLVRVGQRVEVGPQEAVGTSDPGAKAAAWEMQVREWSASLRRELDQLHALPEIPIPAS